MTQNVDASQISQEELFIAIREGRMGFHEFEDWLDTRIEQTVEDVLELVFRRMTDDYFYWCSLAEMVSSRSGGS